MDNSTPIIAEFNWARGLTIDLLRSCSDADLIFTPHERFGVLWKQFRHIGRVQENYMEAIESGAIAFRPSGSYGDGCSKSGLLRYFEQLAEDFEALLSTVEPGKSVNWFGEDTSPEVHWMRLLTHETLHHGQFILYFRALQKTFPESWSGWGE